MGILSHAGNFDASAENETKPLIEGEIGLILRSHDLVLGVIRFLL